MWYRNSNDELWYMRSRKARIFSLGKGCTQFSEQHTLLETELMDSCVNNSLDFRVPSGGGVSSKLEYSRVHEDDGVDALA